ncbi:TMEM175 family protein [Gordonia aurantiaca]|uniref:TMEM175 family protein n=1 Tax=Gordonia sp. B21 TaxID=3151852 RepID=UPI003263E8DF
MAEPENLRSSEGLTRLVAFTDAVVAIALTLLVLPLVDITNDLHDDHETSVAELVGDHSLEITSFVVSFVVIWILWRQHHRTMEYFASYDSVLMNLNFVWLFTIVVLPFTTAMVDDSRVEWANSLYIGTLAVSVACLVGISQWGQRHPDLLVEHEAAESWKRTSGGRGTLLLLTVALIVALVAPVTGIWPLALLFLTDPVEKLIDRVRFGTE